MSPVRLLFSLVLAGSLSCETALADQREEPVVMDEVAVTATRTGQALGELPAQVTLLEKEEIRRAPAQSVDQLLRQVPGFSLFRRASSAVAHPTTQGISLRGLGASGASRALVLLDGMPLNDPFGGWVAWSRVRLASLERIEVVRGGGAQLWGNYTLGGVVSLTSAQPQRRTYSFSGMVGNGPTGSADFALGDRLGATSVALEGGYFNTKGYPVVRADQRGAIDTEAGSQSQTLRLKLARPLSPSAQLYLQAGLWREERENGTPLTQNSSRAGYLGGRATLKTAAGHRWAVAGFFQGQGFDSFFSSAAADRSAETPSLDQHEVPTRAAGASVEWSKPVGAAQLLAAGVDGRWTEGESDEDFRFVEGQFTRRRWAGGAQQALGVYLQEVFIPHPRWQFTLGGRFDWWRTLDSFRREQDLLIGAFLRDDHFADRTRQVFNPKAGVLFKATDHLSLRSGLYRSFRAPTLNELFRPFRVRNDVTEASESLEPEKLSGAEVGLDYQGTALSAHLTGYWNEVEDMVFNLTVGKGPGQVSPCGFVPEGGLCRQRRNLEKVRVQGLEAELKGHRGQAWTGSIGYLLTRTRVVTAAPELEGRRLPQVPAHALSLQLRYDHPTRGQVALQGRYLGGQFEDDLNALELGGVGVVDCALSHPLKKGVEIFFQVENLFGQESEVGISGDGVVSVGAPRQVQGGLRWAL